GHHGHRRLHPCRPGRASQWRATRVHRDPLCPYLTGQQQRLRLRRTERQHDLLQRRRWHRHADRPLRDHDPGARTRRRVGGQARGAGGSGHLPHRQSHVHRPPDRGDHHHRRPDLLPRRLPRTHRRATEPREVLLMTTTTSAPGAPAPHTAPHGVAEARGLFDPEILREALVGSITKLDPRVQVKNPVMFVVLVGSVITLIESMAHGGVFDWSITIWLFLTVIFANFAEAMAEGRGKAQASALRRLRSETMARRLRADGSEEFVAAASLAKDDRVVCEASDVIPSD